MSTKETAQALSAITDEGLFEQLATAILREAEPLYTFLVHPGVNVDGKTVKSPVDAICWVPGADPPHMIAVHHTITARDELEGKWLHDPALVKSRKATGPTAPPGDLLKTAKIVDEERKRTPSLCATLVLTTNQEPDETLVRTVVAAGMKCKITIDVWSRSRLSHYLDNKPAGQWIRHSFLGIIQEQLSAELLHELSKKSLDFHKPPDNPDAWIPRSVDTILASNLHHEVTFLMSGSGLGKTVACYRRLKAHVESGGFGLILPHETIACAMNIDQAITTALRQLHPSLAPTAMNAFSFCSPGQPLLLVVEDINRSGNAQQLATKLAYWGCVPKTSGEVGAQSCWHLVCPLWPEVFASLDDHAKKSIEPLIISAGGFANNEGRDAVLARAHLHGREISLLSATEISCSLGNDPLLIALYDHSAPPVPHQVINQFVEGSLSRAAIVVNDHPAADYRKALRVLAGQMLVNHEIELLWSEISCWGCLQGESLRLLSRLAHQGEMLRFAGSSADQRLLFRHDRVRDWLLADAAAEMDLKSILPEAVWADPYYAEVMGVVLVWRQPKLDLLHRIASSNPLALFYAFRLVSQAGALNNDAILQSINDYLDKPATQNPSNSHLRWEALAVLAETDSPQVPSIVCKFPDRTWSGQLARLRNGDLSGGIELCILIEPGSGAPWRDFQIEHAKLRFGCSLTLALEGFLKQTHMNNDSKIGALRLAGHIADPNLALAIEVCWNTDVHRDDNLAEYLWASGECCANDPPRFLSPVCDAWAALSDQEDGKGSSSPRTSLVAYGVRWAFNKWPPVAALDYLAQRGSKEDLKWPIICLLHGIDHPKAVLYVAKELAAMQKRKEGTGSFSPFLSSITDEWQRAQDQGRPMSKASRELLLGLWRDETSDKYLRSQSFSLWAATHDPKDIDVLCAGKLSNELADRILWERLIRGDKSAIPALIIKLATDERGYWWQCGRHLWAQELTEALDEYLSKRGAQAKGTWGECFESDWITHEMVMRLSESEGERLLQKHWAHLRYCPHFVQTALYIAMPSLQAMAKAAINECSEPVKLMEHLHMRYGIRTKGHPGLTREVQVRALVPYLHLLTPCDIGGLWDACNDHGWFDLRREFLDDRLQERYRWRKWDHQYAISEFDKTVAQKNSSWLGYWIDDMLKTDVSWSTILVTMKEWLAERRSLEALHVVAAAVVHRGTRQDLSVLTTFEGMPEGLAQQLIADTKFAVYRRSLR